MIVGSYLPDRSEITVDLEILATSGDRIPVTTILDTGFTGFLMLSKEQIKDIGATPVDLREMELADGTVRPVARYEVTVLWDGRPKTVFALVNEATKPLLGMKLLHRSLVTLELVSGGSITIERA
ncbi:hypothetical protein [Armatimonas sp.]|uniref:hypothetical protein n=1 Tax=Armatimonas sp. TaxID=1872638 RepID=UPI003752C870